MYRKNAYKHDPNEGLKESLEVNLKNAITDALVDSNSKLLAALDRNNTAIDLLTNILEQKLT